MNFNIYQSKHKALHLEPNSSNKNHQDTKPEKEKTKKHRKCNEPKATTRISHHQPLQQTKTPPKIT